jgi:ABC-type nitrate/sulfonate/bicarbonate transport system permease component
VVAQIEPLPWEAIEKAQPKRTSQARQQRLGLVLGLVGVVGFLALWQAASSLGWVNPLFISSPVGVVASAVALMSGHQFWIDLRISGSEFILGYALAILVGVGLAVVIRWSRVVDALVSPLLSALYATPHVALVPLIIVWFGIGEQSKAVFVFLLAFFPILYNTLAGLRNADPMLVRAARSFGAGPRQVFTEVLLPSAVPFVLTGLRLAVGLGVIAVVVGELYAANAGIGYLISNAGQTLRVADSFVGIVVVALFGGIAMALLQRLERRFSHWRPDR